MPDRLISIAEISRVIPTKGSLPVVVMADDFEDYVCKYDHTNKLINEYVSYKFLEAWGLFLPKVAFVDIKPEHIKQEFIQNRLQPHHFQKPCFALRFEDNAIDVNTFLLGIKGDYNELAKFANRLEILKIAFFDLWTANNDRNGNNFNLLVVSEQNKYYICPIDHSDIFDGGMLGHELTQLTQEDSILSTDLAKVFTINKNLVNDYILDLLLKFDTFVAVCGNILHDVIQDIPDEWCQNKDLLEEQIRATLINNSGWLTDTKNNFKELIQKYIR